MTDRRKTADEIRTALVWTAMVVVFLVVSAAVVIESWSEPSGPLDGIRTVLMISVLAFSLTTIVAARLDVFGPFEGFMVEFTRAHRDAVAEFKNTFLFGACAFIVISGFVIRGDLMSVHTSEPPAYGYISLLSVVMSTTYMAISASLNAVQASTGERSNSSR